MEKERELAIEIINEFEELLNKYEIKIPDEERKGSEEESKIFGTNYWALEDKVTEMIKNHFDKIKIKETKDLCKRAEKRLKERKEEINKILKRRGGENA